MARPPKVRPGVLQRVTEIGVRAAQKCRFLNSDTRYPMIEEIMEGCISSPEDRDCFMEWKNVYRPDTRRRHLVDWGVVPSQKARTLPKGVVRVVIPPGLDPYLKVKGPTVFAIGMAVSRKARVEEPDDRFPEYYVVRITPPTVEDGMYKLAILPFTHFERLESRQI